MSSIHTVKLELLRHGPQHNQLLSPLTPYMTLCGAAAPQTLHMPFEHRQLLLRLARLRYDDDGCVVTQAQREGELRDLGEAIGRTLGASFGLQNVLTSAAGERSSLVHLRLATSALELGMVPFEAAISPDNLPGAGGPLLLRTSTVITREIRRSEPIDVQWNRKPRILFAYATPPGCQPVPAQAHLNALRRAIEPYVARKDSPEARLPAVRALLTVLPEVTLVKLAEACQSGHYTHVHLLAHGAVFEEAGQQRYGVAIWQEGGGRADVVDGERLAIALRGTVQRGEERLPPTLVSLATCDSGQVGQVVAPGGSIAHALHESGIPWVVASQFPLWMKASSIAVQTLYKGLLEGRDPRFVLLELRQRLRTEVPETHDWASIVVYAVTRHDLDDQVQSFQVVQARRRIDVLLERMDELTAKVHPNANAKARRTDLLELDELIQDIRTEHEKWLVRIKSASSNSIRLLAEALGMKGASEKRIGIAKSLMAQCEDMDPALVGQPAWRKACLDDASEAYMTSLHAYESAFRIDSTHHWSMTQFLSMAAITSGMSGADSEPSLAVRYGDWWRAARQIASWNLKQAQGRDRAWAFATLAELELLSTVYQLDGSRSHPDLMAVIKSHCSNVVEAVDPGDFAIWSTIRQFDRYAGVWKRPSWEALARGALHEIRRLT